MMALSRSMKNLMHDSAQARRGGGNPSGPGGGMGRYNPGPKLQRRGGGMMRPAVEPPGPGGYETIGQGKPRPGAGTFGFASQGAGGTPALQEAKLKAKQQSLTQQSRPSLAPAVAGEAAPTPPRRGRMAGAFGTGGSRRYMR